MNTNPLFSMQFHIQTLNKNRRTAGQKLADEIADAKARSLDQLSQCLAKLIPGHLLAQNTSGKHSRSRIFTKQTTFWAFLSQIIDADGGCSEVVSKLRSFAALKCPFKISPSTGAYCTARKNLAKGDIKEVFTHTVKTLDDMEKEAFEGRRVIVVDGTGLTAADTEENQEKWPQQKQQKSGCGFPSLRVCACFSLKTGGVLSYRTGNKKSHELRLFRDQWDDLFREGDINLADKMFSSYFDAPP